MGGVIRLHRKAPVVVLAGAVLDAATSGVPMAIPLIIGGMVLALSLNRMVQHSK